MVEKLTKLNGYRTQFDKLLKEYPVVIALPYVKGESAAELVGKYQRTNELDSIFHKVYGKHFTADEVLDLIAFYKTPAGKKLVGHDEAVRLELREAALKLATEIAIDIVKGNIKKRKEDDGQENPGRFLI